MVPDRRVEILTDRIAAVVDREARGAAVVDREARGAAVVDRIPERISDRLSDRISQKAQGLSPAQEAAVLAAIDAIQELLPHKMPRQQDLLRAHLTTLRMMADSMQSQPPSDDEILRIMAVGEEPLDPSRVEEFGLVLQQRRDQAGLSRAQLATQTGLSDDTLRDLEAGKYPPSQMTIWRLLGIPDLRLQPADLPWRRSNGTLEPALAPNCWLAPGFDPIKMVKDLAMHVNGRGGHIEQTHLYLDPMSAACWCSIAEHEDYVASYGGAPFDRAAAQILKCITKSTARAGLDMIALGCGDGRNEVRLAQHLLRGEHTDMRLYLLDISQPLLSVAYKHAAEALASRRSVSICAIQGNFHQLPCYGQILYTPQRSHRRRLVCMLGYTFGNLQNEVLFIRNSLVGFAAGDLLLLQVVLNAAPVEKVEEIRKKDPRLAARPAEDLQRCWDEFLSGPFKRYGRNVADVEISTVLDTACCPIPGCYGVELRASVKLTTGEKKQFALAYSKRYDLIQLAQTLRQAGWDPVDGWKYGNDRSQQALYLFRKREDDHQEQTV